jgi:hypothetical protein
VEPLGEPAMDLCQGRAGLFWLVLLLPEATQDDRGPQLPRLCLLPAGNLNRAVETGFSLGLIALKTDRGWDGERKRPVPDPLAQADRLSRGLGPQFLDQQAAAGLVLQQSLAVSTAVRQEAHRDLVVKPGAPRRLAHVE